MNTATSLRAASNVVKCHQCTARAFSCNTRQQAQPEQKVQPQSPRYVYVPQPPQQTLPTRPVIKGFLPVPRDVFAGKLGTDDQLDFTLRRATRRPRSKTPPPAAGSWEAWQSKVARQRRQNLIEGSLELRHRKTQGDFRRDQISKAKIAAREEALNRAMREDERLTAQSNNFDIKQLMSGKAVAGDKQELFEQARARYEQHQEMKHQERIRNLHSLYTKARSFIVSKEQLDEAIEAAFGTDEEPVLFTDHYADPKEAHSVWAYGKPARLQDKLNAADRRARAGARDATGLSHLDEAKAARITRIAEELTFGDLGKGLDEKSV